MYMPNFRERSHVQRRRVSHARMWKCWYSKLRWQFINTTAINKSRM